jgi:hypothetical protein
MAVNTPSTIQWSSSAVVQSGFVYLFGAGLVTNSADATVQNMFLARVPTANVNQTSSWTFWNGSSWDVNEANVAPISTNAFDMVRYYNGNWVAVGKPNGVYGTDIFAYTATQPQGPYSIQDLFTDPTNAVLGSGTLLNPVTSSPDYYYSVNPAFHPETSLASGKLLVSLGYEDASYYQYTYDDAELYKPRFYEVTMTNLVISSSLQIWRVGNNIVVNWPFGTLEQATNLMGPWITNSATPPYTNAPTAKQLFFRTIY